MSVRIIIDSASDVSQAEAKTLGIDVLPLKTIFGQEEFLDGVTIDHVTFYQRLIESDVIPTTSQLSPFDFEEAFRSAVENGDEVVCITVSSKLSGCYQSANIAAEEFPGKITVVDSMSVAIGERKKILSQEFFLSHPAFGGFIPHTLFYDEPRGRYLFVNAQPAQNESLQRIIVMNQNLEVEAVSNPMALPFKEIYCQGSFFRGHVMVQFTAPNSLYKKHQDTFIFIGDYQ